MLITPRRLSLSVLTLAIMAACSSIPLPNAQLEQSRTDLGAMQADASTRTLAAVELKQADDAVKMAEAARMKRDDAKDVDHLTYLARQKVAIAQEAVRQRSAEATLAGAEKRRGEARLAARTTEADTAERAAESARRDAEAAKRDTDTAQRDTRAAQMQSQAAQAQVNDARTRNQALEGQLRELNAKQTDRGLVVTLGDMLFATDRASLEGGGRRSVEKLAAVLQANPTRTVSIEGYTDSTGSESHNMTLSEQRADTVRSALLGQGVATVRIRVHGFGEANPVAGNDSIAGRRQNRRVEVVLSDEKGELSAR